MSCALGCSDRGALISFRINVPSYPLWTLPPLDPLNGPPDPLAPLSVVERSAQLPGDRLVMPNPFYTIGHSARSLPDFVELLKSAAVGLVADVRTVPRSRTNPQFNRDILPDSLAEVQIGYEHIPALGGLRGRQRGEDLSPNTYWENESFRNYADYAMGDAFRSGLARLRNLGRERRCAIMCAEAVWWRCHRRIISDYLLAAGEIVFHILGPDHIEQARLTPAARRASPDGLVYPAAPP